MKNENNHKNSFQRAGERLCKQLTLHPHLRERVAEVREEIDGLKNIKQEDELHYWEINNREEYQKLVERVYSIREEFDIPKELKTVVMLFLLDYIPLNKSNAYLARKGGLRMREGGKDTPVQEEAVYLEVTPQTTLEDIKDNWSDIKKYLKKRKGVGPEKRSFGVANPTQKAERAYVLTQIDSKNAKDAAKQINDEFDLSGDDIKMENDINSLVHQYKKVLNNLKPLE